MAPIRNSTGFSLVEALVATLVFSIGVVGVMPLIAGAARAVRDARDTGMATWLAWQKLEEQRGVIHSRGAAGLDVDTGAFVDHLDQFGRQVTPPGLYTRRWTVTPAGARALRIAVRVHHAATPGTPIVLGSLTSRRAP
jgi:type II secretory pathway pseudopilin PulG